MKSARTQKEQKQQPTDKKRGKLEGDIDKLIPKVKGQEAGISDKMCPYYFYLPAKVSSRNYGEDGYNGLSFLSLHRTTAKL